MNDKEENKAGTKFFRGKEAYLATISSRWRKLYMISLVIALSSAFTACFTFLVFESKFSPHCPLFAKLSIARVHNDYKSSLSYVVVEKETTSPVTKWGPDTACSFVLYVPLINMLAAVMLILFYCVKGYSPNFHRKLQPLTCLTGLIISVISFADAVVVTLGGSLLCESFRVTELERCIAAQYVHWINFSAMQGFYDYLVRCQISSWLTTHTWFFLFLMVLIRWATNADYVIAEEREFNLPPENHNGGSSVLEEKREEKENEYEQEQNSEDHKESSSDEDKENEE